MVWKSVSQVSRPSVAKFLSTRLLQGSGIQSLASLSVSTPVSQIHSSSFLKSSHIQRNSVNSIQNQSTCAYCRQLSTTSTMTSSAGFGVPYGTKRVPEIVASLESSNGVCTLTINRPEKANAFNLSMYRNLGELIKETNSDPDVKIVVLTANGKFFSAGNDLTIWEGDGHDTSVIRNMVDALIDLKKPLLALVNGPAIGIGATMLAHADGVYAAKSAYFLTPFTTLGICAEACSSYLFPKMMGYTKATEMLMLNAKIGADEAAGLGLVTRVFPDETFVQETAKIVATTAKLPTSSIMTTKELIRGPERERLHGINQIEFERVGALVEGEECMQAVAAFLEAKKMRMKL